MLSIHFIMYKPNICTYKHIHMISKWNHCFIDNKSTPMPSENTHTHTETRVVETCFEKCKWFGWWSNQVIVQLSAFRTCHMLIRCYTLSFFKMCTYPLVFFVSYLHTPFVRLLFTLLVQRVVVYTCLEHQSKIFLLLDLEFLYSVPLFRSKRFGDERKRLVL